MKDKKDVVIPPWLEVFNPIPCENGDLLLHEPSKPYEELTDEERFVENLRRSVMPRNDWQH